MLKFFFKCFDAPVVTSVYFLRFQSSSAVLAESLRAMEGAELRVGEEQVHLLSWCPWEVLAFAGLSFFMCKVEMYILF